MRRILIAAVASSLLTGAAIAATGVAQSGDDDKASPPPTMAQALEQRKSERDKRLAAIAKRLDVSGDALQAAIEKVRAAQLDRAVADGKLTGAQRDAIRACQAQPLTCDRSNLPAHRAHHRALRMRGGRPDFRALERDVRGKRDAFFAAVAKELGKDTADVRRAFRAERPRIERAGPGGPHRGPHGPGVVLPAPAPGGPGFEGPAGPGLDGP